MALKIRLRQQGRKNFISYRLVIVDSREKRDGKYVEMIGWYNPTIEGNEDVMINEERVLYWLDQGAQLTEKVRALIARKVPGIIKGINERKREKLIKRSEKRKAQRTAS